MRVYSPLVTTERFLGTGAGSRVFLARDAVSGRRLVLRRFAGEPRTRVSAPEQFVLLRQLARSGFIEPKDIVSGAGENLGYTYDYIESSTLGQLPASSTDAVILGLLHGTAEALRWLHALGYLHCDLKPANVLCVSNGDRCSPRVLDLDLAHRIGDRLLSKIVGTGGYIPPELIDGEELTCAADIFSFGVMLRELRPRFADPKLGEAIEILADRCTHRTAQARLQVFEAVCEELSAIARRCTLPIHADPAFEPPLRESGLNARVRSFQRHLRRADNQGVTLVCGAPGLGKSLLLREWCRRLQMEGCSTLRFENVDDAASFDAGLERTVSTLRRAVSQPTTSPIHVIVETSPAHSVSTDHTNRLARTAQSLGLRVYVECRTPRSRQKTEPFPIINVRALSERECIEATGHLIQENGPVGMNGKCLGVLTGGAPALLRMAVKSQGRLARAMPADIDYLSVEILRYWTNQFHELEDHCQWLLLRASVFHRRFSPQWLPMPSEGERQVADTAAVCERSGWIVRQGRLAASDAYRFVCRSARNAVQVLAGQSQLMAYAASTLSNHNVATAIESAAPLEYLQLQYIAGHHQSPGDSLDDSWRHVQNPEDEKLLLLMALRYVRELKACGRRPTLAHHARCCEAFARLGNFRSQKRWAQKGLHLLATEEGNPCPSADVVTQTCRLWDQTGDHVGKKAWLERTIPRVPDPEISIRGALLSELGSVQLMRGELQSAHETLHQAQACLSQAGTAPETVVHNMIRLGIAQGLLKKFNAAERSLTRALGFDQSALTADIRRRALANLGWNAQRAGRPTRAIPFLLEAMRLFDRAGVFPGHVAMLSNLVVCFVDMGHGFRARRAALSAAALARSIRDTIQIAYAMNNLGWVLGMQNRMAEARDALEAAARAARELGDPLSEFRVRLNVARLYATAQISTRAVEICDELQESLGDQMGYEERWDRARLLAKVWIDSGRYDQAAEALDLIPPDHPELTARDRTSAALLRASLHLWRGDAAPAETVIRQLRREPIIANIHPLRCELLKLSGHLELVTGAYDAALDALGQAAQACRTAGRKDQLIEIISLHALLASRMGNSHTARRYLHELERMENEMQEDLR